MKEANKKLGIWSKESKGRKTDGKIVRKTDRRNERKVEQ